MNGGKNIVLLVTFIGIVIISLFTSYQNRSGDMYLVGFQRFWDNFCALLLGLPVLMDLTTMGSWVGAASIRAVPYYCNILLFALFVFSVVFIAIKHFVRQEYKTKTNTLFLICVCAVDYFIFALIDSKAGSPIFEARYLIFMFVCGLFIVAMFIDLLKDTLIFKNLLLCIMVLAVAVSNVNSYYQMNKREGACGADLVDVFAKYDVRTVYGVDHSGCDNGIQIRNMRVLDTSKVYKLIYSYDWAHHWGDYTYYDDISDVPEGGVLLYMKAEELEKWPEHIRNAFILKEELADANIYYSEKAVFDLVSGLPKSGDRSVDLPTSPNVQLGEGELDSSGAFVSSGKAGYALNGPYEQTPSGKYEFKLNYKVLSSENENAGAFEITVNNGEKVLERGGIDPQNSSVTVIAEFTEGDIFNYRVYCAENSVIEIQSIEMTRIHE